MTHRFTTAAAFSTARPGHPTWQYLVREFTEALALSPPQLMKIEPLVEEAGERLADIRLEAVKKAKAIIHETIAQIRPVLSEEQQRNVDTWQRIERALTAAREIEQRAR